MRFKIFIISCFVGLAQFGFGQPLLPPATDRALSGANPPGYVDPALWGGTCYSYMGAIDFSSSYRFITSYWHGTPPAEWAGGLLNPASDRMVGFSIPLVADLDNDGYPEIITLGQTDNGYSLYGAYEYVYIYNGQTGKKIAKLPFKDGTTAMTFTHSGFHGSPSPMALVNSDPINDTIVEFIIGFPNGGGTANYRSRLVSYNLIPTKSGSTTTGYTMTEKWKSAAPYNIGGATSVAQTDYEKPVPTVVDLDGDGTPEVVVYNKVYNAKTGALLLTLETLNAATSPAHVGYDANAYGYDGYIGYNYVYDMDFDGIYDIVAGGKFYKIKKSGSTFTYTTYNAPGSIPDGRTGVADIDGDGIPDIVSVSRVAPPNSAIELRIVVWNPNFLVLDVNDNVVANTGTPAPKILADVTFSIGRYGGSGSNSYVYIGDIDGREQSVTIDGKTKKYRLPEIAVLARQLTYNTLSVHPNVSGITTGNGGFPTSGTSTRVGDIVALTWDAQDGVAESARLKLSFVLEHNDRSNNTGFTMFDFDNDGKQEICYRDETTLRIIKAAQPFVPLSLIDNKVILFKETVNSFTGFEYPVIADIDNDASAEMVVIGNDLAGDYATGYVYAVGTKKDKFAPALAVWNQFMYDPFKINENLTTPQGVAVNRLQFQYRFTQVIRDDNGIKTEAIENYNPYNGTLGQLPRFMLNPGEHDNIAYDDMFEPIIFLTEAYLVDEKSTDVAKRPKIVTIDSKFYIQVYVGNKSSAKTDIAGNTPITLYNDKIGGGTYIKKVTLKECGLAASAIKAGELVMLNIPIDNQFIPYIFRLGDDTNFANPANILWHFGTNVAQINNQVAFTGTSTRAYRDCKWEDQTARAALFLTVDDLITLQEYGNMTIDMFANDILPASNGTFVSLNIKTQPEAGTATITGTGASSKITYTHTNVKPLAEGIDSIVYEVTYNITGQGSLTKKATIYIFILQSDLGGFVACYNESFTAKLKDTPIGTQYNWFKADGTTPVGTNPQQSITIPNLTATTKYKVKPVVPVENLIYGALDFPQGDLTIYTATNSAGETKAFTWTGAISSDWYNPANWKNDVGAVATFAPTSCIDVTIPKVTTNYPSLSKAGKANKVNLTNRAMIANTHKLTYKGLSVALTLKNEEQNKWMLLSAPLRKIYSGDYLPFVSNVQIKKGMYMSYYEKTDPDNAASPAATSTFTRPFGKIESELPLGQGFMLYADKNYVTNPTLIFPAATDTYTYNMHNAQGMVARTKASGTLSRMDGAVDVSKGRFLFESATDLSATDGSFTIPYSGTYILIVNPFPTYLILNKLLDANSGILAQEYKIWSGTSDSFIELTNGTGGTTWKIKSGAALTTVVSGTDILIPPFQSFFVKSKTSGVINIKYQPETMTKVIATDFTY